MRKKFIILLFGISNIISAQINYSNSSWYIKGSASSLIDIFTFPTVQLSVEKQLSDYISVCAEGGYQLYTFSRADTSFLNPTGFKANLELRYYLSKFITTRLSNKLGRPYAAIRPFYWQTQYNASISYKTKQDSPVWSDDDFGVKNKSWGVDFIIGFQKSITERLIIDLHTGVGIMYRTVINEDIQYVKDSGYLLAGTDLIKYFKGLSLAESSGLRGVPLFGFRLGYTIYK
jgi:hypothetical protein